MMLLNNETDMHARRQTSIRSGTVLGMGKGFLCSDSVKGRDLGDAIQQGFVQAVSNPMILFSWCSINDNIAENQRAP